MAPQAGVLSNANTNAGAVPLTTSSSPPVVAPGAGLTPLTTASGPSSTVVQTSTSSFGSITNGQATTPLTTNLPSGTGSRLLPGNNSTTVTAITSFHPETATPSQSSKSTAISAGPVAGIAIGCAIVGLIIGIIAAFCVFHRRKRTAAVDGAPVVMNGEPKAFMSESKAVGDSADKRSKAAYDIQLHQFLLEPTPNSDITRELQSLGDLIQQHVETHYHPYPVNAGVHSLSQNLLSLGFPSHSHGIGAETLATICIEPKTRITGLRHVISQAIFRSIDFRSQSRTSLLPASVHIFLKSIPQTGDRRDDRTEDETATSLAISRWRSLSAFLLHPSRNERTTLPISTRETPQQAQELTDQLNAFLQHFVQRDQGSRQAQTHHLHAVAMECAKFGYMILSQPSDWRFGFGKHTATVSQGLFVPVCVGLERVTDRNGNPYQSPRAVLDPLVVSIS